ncbi:hydroxymethylglutaryl-CoA synthase family protein [Sneathiella sp. HT1-7]|uniref:hydroxymethylglutaryl-CoA synthase family protein n=1 Tax=Sneathiella sp. HT1-7 TaxID=2887192 RepID=UPI001D13AEBB|nr:3-oxoacyl-[acyl-carrier-protein] synthase III C-terminal domain-containing protein [Sneathiella sp. HT1-7]MCC3303229.1 OB-fold domain-containing protein [Sneathiella sp. HT1-7]
MEVGILAYGGYIPQSRLQRSEIAKAHSWFNPGLNGLAKGERAMANWDEDSVTMAVEAARDCLADSDRNDVSAVYMASTSFPFMDRQNAGIVADALNLNSSLQTLDFASSQRAGSAGLATALQVAKGGSGPILFTAAEKRQTKAASPLEFTSGDGAAAFLVGQGKVIARLLGSHTEAVDFVDHFRGEGEAYDYNWEERWIRDEGYLKIVPSAISALLSETGVKAEDVTTFCFPVAARGVAGMLAKKLGIPESSVADNLQANCGETGTAHSMVMLSHALENSKPGDKILVASFGQGSDALLFEVTEEIKSLSPRKGVSGYLARRYAETNYNKFLAFHDLVNLERGIRAETDKKTGLTTLYRNKGMTQAMIGGQCSQCGTAQFPKSNMCVNENCGAIGTQEDYPFAERISKVNSFTADRLTYSPDPPAYYGMIQFEEGGRLMSDFTDISPETDIKVGMPMRMMFRVKDYDNKRGFRRYFWKATPADASNKGE